MGSNLGGIGNNMRAHETAARPRRVIGCSSVPELAVIREDVEGFDGLPMPMKSRSCELARAAESLSCRGMGEAVVVEVSIFAIAMQLVLWASGRILRYVLLLLAFLTSGRRRRSKMRRTGGYRGKLLAAAWLADHPREHVKIKMARCVNSPRNK